VHWELTSPAKNTGVRDVIHPVRSSTPYERQTQTRFPYEFGTCILDRIHGFFGCYALISLKTIENQGQDGPACHLFWIKSNLLWIESKEQRADALWESQERPNFHLIPL
jgi:hypothetical protein